MRRFWRRFLRCITRRFRPPVAETVMADLSGHPDFAIVEGIWVREYPDGYIRITVLADECEDLDRPYLLHAEHRLATILQCPLDVVVRATRGRDPMSDTFYSPGSRLLYRRDM